MLIGIDLRDILTHSGYISTFCYNLMVASACVQLRMFLKKKIESLGYALKGLGIAWQEEHNFRFEIFWAAFALFLAFFLRLPQIEFLVVIFMIGFVLTAETLNTALEELCNKFQPTHDLHVAKIKDLAAAAVLISSITAFTVGLIIFIPHLASFIWRL